MLALLPSPSPPQIMPLIINRMRACSSWKAGTGTSLLNGAAQLGLKLFNRNMKAPSVRCTGPSEVTAHHPSPASTPLPPAPAILPLLSPCPIQRCPPCTPSFSHTSKLCSFTSAHASWFIQLPGTRFSQPGPSLPSGRISSLTSSQSQAWALFAFSCIARLSLCSTVCSGAGMPSVCPGCTRCALSSPSSPLWEGRAESCPLWQHLLRSSCVSK